MSENHQQDDTHMNERLGVALFALAALWITAFSASTHASTPDNVASSYTAESETFDTCRSNFGSEWNGWGRDDHNSRFQPAPQLSPRSVRRLQPRWVFAYPGEHAWG